MGQGEPCQKVNGVEDSWSTNGDSLLHCALPLVEQVPQLMIVVFANSHAQWSPLTRAFLGTGNLLPFCPRSSHKRLARPIRLLLPSLGVWRLIQAWSW